MRPDTTAGAFPQEDPMPLIAESTYRPNRLHRLVHPSTFLPTLLRPAAILPWQRERVELPDGDFLDLDRLRQGADRTVLLCHGLEGNSRRKYMLGMARAFFRRGWDVVGFNFRGCSGEPNRLPRSYHAGATEDLREAIAATDHAGLQHLALVGFSMGGNLILKYLGEDPAAVHPALRAAVAFSVPAELGDSCLRLAQPGNWIYQRRFLRKLARKIRGQAQRHPGAVDAAALDRVKNLWDFDDAFTAPLHGFRDASDYYARCSCLYCLEEIRVPALLVNALNDPFLMPRSFPRAQAEASRWLHLETPEYGGHVGFHAPGDEYWSDRRAVEFITAVVSPDGPSADPR